MGVSRRNFLQGASACAAAAVAVPVLFSAVDADLLAPYHVVGVWPPLFQAGDAVYDGVIIRQVEGYRVDFVECPALRGQELSRRAIAEICDGR